MVARTTSILLIVAGLLSQPALADEPPAKLVHVTLAENESDLPPTLSGRILVTAQDGGILLEERNGTLHNLTPERFTNIESSEQNFRWLTSDEFSMQLIKSFGSSFGLQQTPHFILCSAGSDAFTQHCGQLLEKVYTQFFEFFDESGVAIHNPPAPLIVVIFRHATELRQHAAQQHPETTFEDVPGYYSSRFNQMYVSDMTTGSSRNRRELLKLLKRTPRHTETIVHEAVHLLAYNSGLHVRFADNPLWFTEGLATYFEPSTKRGRLLWNGPGSPNGMYLGQLKRDRRKQTLPVPLAGLLADNRPFQQTNTVAAAYASSWALMYYLIRKERELFDQLATTLQERAPLQEVPAVDELKMFTELSNKPQERLEYQTLTTVRRLRSR